MEASQGVGPGRPPQPQPVREAGCSPHEHPPPLGTGKGNSGGAEAWLYLYGIVPATGFDLSGLEGVEAGGDVFLVESAGLSCAVSPVPLRQYSQEALAARAGKAEWIAARAIRHQQVVDRLKATGSVIPLKFGTLCATCDDVRTLLQAHAEALGSRLDLLQDREEWGVKVNADLERARQAVEAVGSSADETPPASAGEAYFLRKKRERQAKEQLMLQAAELEHEIYSRLSRSAVEACKGSCLAASAAPSHLPVLNAALLMDRGQLGRLEEIAGQLEADYRAYGVAVEITGPWAPYSFCGDLGRPPD